MTYTGVFTIAINLGESLPFPDASDKNRERMRAITKLIFDDVEAVDYTIVHSEPEPQLQEYHCTAGVTLKCDVNSLIAAKTPEAAKQHFIKIIKDGLDVTVINAQSIDVQELPDIQINEQDIDIDILLTREEIDG